MPSLVLLSYNNFRSVCDLSSFVFFFVVVVVFFLLLFYFIWLFSFLFFSFIFFSFILLASPITLYRKIKE